jgi:hypothetical protein
MIRAGDPDSRVFASTQAVIGYRPRPIMDLIVQQHPGQGDSEKGTVI